MQIIRNSHEFLTVFMTVSITISVLALIFLSAVGIARLTDVTIGLLIGTITNVGLVAVIRHIFGKPQEQTPTG